MIESWHIRETLRSRLGSSLVDEPGFADPLAVLLREYAPYKDTFADLASKVEDQLFNMLYERLGPSMSVRMSDGSSRRVRTAELESGSFSAMRTLYLRYGDFMSPGEKQVLARVIQGARPDSYWRDWLNRPAGGAK